jgi:hypothetical protein
MSIPPTTNTPPTFQKAGDHFDPYASEADTAELLRIGKMPEALRLADMLEREMQHPGHGRAADCLRKMHDLLIGCENELRYAGWDKREADNPARNDVYEEVKKCLGNRND